MFLTHPDIEFKCFATTDTGRRRPHNEDAYVCDPDIGIFLIADGMGGENFGEVASSLTADHFIDIIKPFMIDDDMTIPFDHTDDEDYFLQTLKHAANETNKAVMAFAEENQSHKGMGSTLTAVIFHNQIFYVVHVGDSRLYRFDGKILYQETEDHTRVQEMVNKELLTQEDARFHPDRHIITRCVGRQKRMKPDIFALDISFNSIYLICSDGLNDMITDLAITEILETTESLELAGQALINLANENGGKDNITVVLFQAVSKKS